MEVSMIRKIVIASTLGLFLATSVVTPASAATIKTGSACKKAGQTVKVGKKVYVCGKNPIVTPTRNTYMLKACSDISKGLAAVRPTYDEMLELAKNNNLATLTDLGNVVGGSEKKFIDDLVAVVERAQVRIPVDCRKGA
jgi:hypothetical protein